MCESCWLVQTEDFAEADRLFDAEHAYFSYTSKSWLDHSVHFAAAMIARFRLGLQNNVIKVASNDRPFFTYFVDVSIPCLGIEPTGSCAVAAKALRIVILDEFF